MVEDNEAIIESWIASCETIEQLANLIQIVHDRVQNEKVQSNLIELIHRKEKSLSELS